MARLEINGLIKHVDSLGKTREVGQIRQNKRPARVLVWFWIWIKYVVGVYLLLAVVAVSNVWSFSIENVTWKARPGDKDN